MHKQKMILGLVAGSIAGVAASALAFEHVCPGVSNKFFKNGKRMVGRYKRQMNF